MTTRRIDPRRLPSEVRRVNRDLMAQFIGADPYGRRHPEPMQVDRSLQRGRLFSVRVERKPNHSTFLKLYQQTPVRLYSRGV